MALDEGDKNTCKEIAREIVQEVLLVHIPTCPHGLLILKYKSVLIGLLIGSAGLGGGLMTALIKIFS